MELYDKVRIKSLNVIGFIVYISGEYYAVEKEGNEGPIYWEVTADDLEPVK
jgi:hypothetical protein